MTLGTFGRGSYDCIKFLRQLNEKETKLAGFWLSM